MTNALSHTAKLILSGSLSVLSVILFLSFKGRERKLVMYAMLLSTLGDVFMTDTFHMGGRSVIPGAAFFIASHVVYIICFTGAVRNTGRPLVNVPFRVGVILTAVAAGDLFFMMMNIAKSVQPMFFPLLIYLAVIGMNLSCQYSYAAVSGGTKNFLALGMTLFLISDFIVFLPMLNVCGEMNDLVWATYVPAQLLIVLFNSDFKKQ